MKVNGSSLHIQGVSAGYRNKPIISDLSLPEIAPGTVTALIGPNAAGKSTLMKSLAGVIPARGTFSTDGINLLTADLKTRASKVSFMPQYSPQDINLTVIESVISAFKQSLWDAVSSSSQSAYDRAFSILIRVGVDNLAMENINQLSGGQKQLVSLARAMVRNPEVLLLDEPTSALDLHHQVRVMRLIRSFANEGHTILVVLHDLNLAMKWADQVVVMQKGNVAAVGRPVDALTPEIIRNVYQVKVRVEHCSEGKPVVLIDG